MKSPNKKTVKQRDLTKIKSGDLLAWSYDELSGWYRFVNKTIQLMTLSSYSHVGIAIVDGGDTYVLEATRPYIKLSKAQEKGHFYVVSMNLENTEELMDIAKEYLGKPYSLMDCVRAFFGYQTAKDDQYQCAELCAEVYERLGEEFFPEKNTPQGLVKAALSYTGSSLWYF